MYAIVDRILTPYLQYRTSEEFKESTIWSILEKRVIELSTKIETELNR